MSLLWIEAVGPGSRERHVQQIVAAHPDVDVETARKALQWIRKYLKNDTVSPTRAGFAGTPMRGTVSGLPDAAYTPSAWQRTEVKPLGPGRTIYAGQHHLHVALVAHHIFHPGTRPPMDRNQVGNPDTPPGPEITPWDGDGLPTDAPRLISRHDGSLVTHDGHHQLAAGLILGCQHARGRTLDLQYQDDGRDFR